MGFRVQDLGIRVRVRVQDLGLMDWLSTQTSSVCRCRQLRLPLSNILRRNRALKAKRCTAKLAGNPVTIWGLGQVKGQGEGEVKVRVR